VVQEKVAAAYNDGVLTVTVPIRPDSKGRTVPVRGRTLG
jgi:HSP20 family molecular chaperone IbpA